MFDKYFKLPDYIFVKSIKINIPLTFAFLAIGILNIPNVIIAFYGVEHVNASLLSRLSFVILTFGFMLLPIAFWRPKRMMVILLPILFFLPLEIVTVMIYKSPLNFSYLNAIFSTNTGEATEYMNAIVPQILFIVFLNTLYFSLVVFSKDSYRCPKWVRVFALSAFISSVIVFVACEMDKTYKMQPNSRFSSVLFEGWSNSKTLAVRIFPISSFSSLYYHLDFVMESKKYRQNIASKHFFATKSDTTKGKVVYVLVIGESSRKANWQLFGYNRPTNPRLSKEPNLVCFQNCWASANLTMNAVPMILTCCTPSTFQTFNSERPLFSLFKEVGFSTAWISNQSVMVDNLEKYNIDTDYCLEFAKHDEASSKYDGRILEPLTHWISKNDSNKFVVVNTIGSHFKYNSRYPAEFKQFMPALDESSSYFDINKGNRQTIVNSYDNSILYTDYFLSEIISSLKKEKCPAVMIYLSDHGECLYDEGDHFSHGSLDPTDFELQIPLVVWYSDEYKALSPLKVEALNLNCNKKVSTTNMFCTVGDLATISFPSENLSKSIVSNSFVPDSLIEVLLINRGVAKR